MLQKFRKYFSGGLPLLLFLWSPLLLTGTPLPAPVSKYYPVRFEDPHVSPRARTIVLVNRLRKDIMQCLPATTRNGAIPRKITFLYEKGNPVEVFSIRKNKHGNYTVALPENCEDLLNLKDALPELCAWMLAASAGMDPEKAGEIRHSWYVTGIARKLLRFVTPVKSPFTQYFPSAYVLTSHDRYPPLKSLLNQELSGEDSCARLLYEEYSELLVLICIRQGLFRKGLLPFLMEKTRMGENRKDMAVYFQDFAFRHLGTEKKGKRLFKLRTGKETHAEEVLEQFFRRETEKILNWNFLPGSALKLEKHYRKATTFEAPLKKEKNKENNTVRIAGKKYFQKNSREVSSGGSTPETPTLRGDLLRLTRVYPELADEASPALKMALETGKIAFMASPDLLPALLEVRSALLAFAGAQTSATVRRLQQADANFHRALERNVLLEKFLEETERKVLSASIRYYATLTLLEKDPVKELPTFRRLEKFLLETQRKYPDHDTL